MSFCEWINNCPTVFVKVITHQIITLSLTAKSSVQCINFFLSKIKIFNLKLFQPELKRHGPKPIHPARRPPATPWTRDRSPDPGQERQTDRVRQEHSGLRQVPQGRAKGREAERPAEDAEQIWQIQVIFCFVLYLGNRSQSGFLFPDIVGWAYSRIIGLSNGNII